MNCFLPSLPPPFFSHFPDFPPPFPPPSVRPSGGGGRGLLSSPPYPFPCPPPPPFILSFSRTSPLSSHKRPRSGRKGKEGERCGERKELPPPPPPPPPPPLPRNKKPFLMDHPPPFLLHPFLHDGFIIPLTAITEDDPYPPTSNLNPVNVIFWSLPGKRVFLYEKKKEYNAFFKSSGVYILRLL